jgi:hypothetical protein
MSSERLSLLPKKSGIELPDGVIEESCETDPEEIG